MEGQIIIIVGGRGHGKTTMLRRFTTKAHPEALLLHDVSGQHKDYYKRPLLEIDQFNAICKNVENCMIAYEEATIFIPHSPKPDIKHFLVTSRYRNNTILFVFHSLRAVPRYILDLSNKVILMKTNDIPEVIEKKFQRPDFMEVFKRVNASPDKYAYESYTILQ